ncbi:MAG: bifunctional 5,10-methylenetetrahydrofolate dehydrogenase/5,10-methenyltetrahydrofolate cyclohydrolase, partial [Candidatus Zipacnadales bacterium]
MSATPLLGKPIADKIKEELVKEIAALKDCGITPKLVALLVGENPGAEFYAGMQEKGCASVGIDYELKKLPTDTPQDELETLIHQLNQDKTVSGIILLMPVPPQINGRAMQAAIDPHKDVDGVHPVNLGRVVQGDRTLAPCTAQSVLALAEASGVALKGAEVCVVGHSEIVGKPVALLFLELLATVTVCHIGTRDTASHTRNAEILVSATGVPGLIKPDWVKPGAIVIDVG